MQLSACLSIPKDELMENNHMDLLRTVSWAEQIELELLYCELNFY